MRYVRHATLIGTMLVLGFFGPGCWTAFGDEDSGPSQLVPILDVVRPDASSDAMVSFDTGKGDAGLLDAELDASNSGLDADF